MGEEYKSFSSSLCNILHSPVTSSLLGPNILLNTMFSNTLTFFLQWEMSLKKFVEEIKTHILCSVTLSRQLRSNVEKYVTARQAKDYYIKRTMGIAY